MDNKTIRHHRRRPGGPDGGLGTAAPRRQRVIVLEASGDLGGISRTVQFQGNRIDIGGHRFFSKSDWVMDWWQNILPIAGAEPGLAIAYQNAQRRVAAKAGPAGPAAPGDDRVMLVRNRLSRIYFQGRFFAYPVKANLDTALQLGPLPRRPHVGQLCPGARLPPPTGGLAGGFSAQPLRARAL
jgi:hypothetical protein